MKAIRLSLTQAAAEFGTTRDTIRKGLHRLELLNGQQKKNQKFTIYDLHRAIAGDLKFERTRHERAEANIAEREDRIKEGNVIEWERVERRLNERFFLPLQTALDAAPEGVSREWVERVLKPILRTRVESPGPPV